MSHGRMILGRSHLQDWEVEEELALFFKKKLFLNFKFLNFYLFFC